MATYCPHSLSFKLSASYPSWLADVFLWGLKWTKPSQMWPTLNLWTTVLISQTKSAPLSCFFYLGPDILSQKYFNVVSLSFWNMDIFIYLSIYTYAYQQSKVAYNFNKGLTWYYPILCPINIMSKYITFTPISQLYYDLDGSVIVIINIWYDLGMCNTRSKISAETITQWISETAENRLFVATDYVC